MRGVHLHIFDAAARISVVTVSVLKINRRRAAIRDRAVVELKDARADVTILIGIVTIAVSAADAV